MIDPAAITVMKFGGTSVADACAIRQLVDIVRTTRARTGSNPVVVVSAMAGVTDALLRLVRDAERGSHEAVATRLDQVALRHHTTAADLLGDRSASLVASLDAHLADMRAVLIAVEILREASPRSIDAVAATGELLSSRIVAAALDAAGVASASVDARRVLVTDDRHGAAVPAVELTQEAVGAHLLPLVRSGRIPVVGGYIGATTLGVTTTLGRGGSDYSAAIFGAALGASEVQIWTDVDGMLSGDPRVVDEPRVVPRLSFDEASELAYFGAKVLHPSTILPAMRRNLPVRILNSRRPEGRGTLITREGAAEGGPVAALACKRGVTVLDMTSTRMLMAHGFLRRLFEVFERHGTAVDVVTTSEVSVSVTIDDDRAVDAIAAELRAFAEVKVVPGMAILCAVGDALRRDPRLASRAIAALGGFPIGMVSQAASRRNLTIVIPEEQLAAAMGRLHAEFFAEVTA